MPEVQYYLSGLLFQFLPIPDADNSPNLSTFIAFLFYLLSEIPIFLMVNIIWMVTADYFTEQQGQRDFPRISAAGLFGVSLASLTVLAAGWLVLPLFWLNFLWGILCLILWVISMGILMFNRPLPVEIDFVIEEAEPIEEEQLSFFRSFMDTLRDGYRWVANYPFLRAFTIVTILNFVLLAIFDQTLANGARHIGISAQVFSTMLAYWTLGFGFLAGLFQLFLFPRLLARLGVAKLNLYAPSFMFAGAFAYLLFASDFLDPIWNTINVSWRQSSNYLLAVVMGARICGWIAEFLFNQSMLPFVYGALPRSDESRARIFVEGSVTSITNGSIGLFLLLYFILFRDAESGNYGFKLDLLYILALFAATFMLFYSFRMISLFRDVLQQRAREGDNVESLTTNYGQELSVDKDLMAEQLAASRLGGEFSSLLRIYVRSAGIQSAATLADLFSTELPAKHRALIMQELVNLNAVHEFNRVWKIYQDGVVPSAVEFDIMSQAAQLFGRSSDLRGFLQRCLNTMQLDREQLRVVLIRLSQSGFDGALVVGEYIEKYGSQMDSEDRGESEKAIRPLDIYVIAARLGSDQYYPQLARAVREQEETADIWDALGAVEFFDHRHTLDAFSLMLTHVEDERSGAAGVLIDLLKRYRWLGWPLLWIMEQPSENFREEAKPFLFGRPVWSVLLARSLQAPSRGQHVVDFDLSQLDFAASQLTTETGQSDFAPELRGVNWSGFNAEWAENIIELTQVGTTRGIDFAVYLVDRLNAPERYGGDVGMYTGMARGLHELVARTAVNLDELGTSSAAHYALSRFRAATIQMSLFEHKYPVGYDWSRRRRLQWLRTYLLLLACRYPESRSVINIDTADHLLLGEADANAVFPDEYALVRRDRTLSLLEQSGIPRSIFIDLRSDLENLRSLLLDRNVIERYVGGKYEVPRNEREARTLWNEIGEHEIQDHLWNQAVGKLEGQVNS